MVTKWRQGCFGNSYTTSREDGRRAVTNIVQQTSQHAYNSRNAWIRLEDRGLQRRRLFN